MEGKSPEKQEKSLSKALDSIIIGRISRLINYVDSPEDLIEQLDNLRYFVEKKRESLQPVNKQTNM